MAQAKMHLAVLMTCHDRRAKTVASLEALGRAIDGTSIVSIEVFLTDDGSTDGTSKAVQQLSIPVTVVTGGGDLYWNRGMVRAWEAADASGCSFDGYLLLNDDTVLDSGGLANIVCTCQSLRNECIVVGAVTDPTSGTVTYGGVRRVSAWHPGRVEIVEERGAIQDVDTFNANCVLVPAGVRQRLGTLDPTFTHGIGDLDYGLRARALGIRVVVAPGTVGSCPRNGAVGSWRDQALTLKQRLQALESPKGIPRGEWEVFLRRHGAPIPWLLSWVPTVRAFGISLSGRRGRMSGRGNRAQRWKDDA